MKILGLSSNYHDASAALVVNGVIVAAAAEERFTLQKHDPNFPLFAARFCLEEGGLSADDLDFIAYHEDTAAKFSRTLAASLARFPFSLPTFIKSMREMITGGFWIKNRISSVLNVDPRKIVYIPHHCGHAAHAFLTSPFDQAAILTLDAAGEWMCSGLFQGDREKGIEPVSVVPFPHSLGLVYSAFTGFLGFKVNDGECSTMALAAFGRPKYADEVRRVIKATPDGTYEVDTSYFDFTRDDSLPLTKKFTELFGPARSFRDSLPFDCLADKQGSISAEERRYADIAASLQTVLEEVVLKMARALKEKTGLTRLCLSGGVALNCVMVGKIAESGIFDEVFVPADPGDGGGALGAALFQGFQGHASDFSVRTYAPYLGKKYSEDDVLAILPLLEEARGVAVHATGGIAETARLTAQLLAEGKIVGWHQGRFEVGPRALGNRSILCDPGNLASVRRLSERVKRRAFFRPYACSVASEDVEDVFGESRSARSPSAAWMQISCDVLEPSRARIRGALHVDGSTRPHVCTEEGNPRLHGLLQQFGKLKGLSALLNTSFNESGMPIVASPVNALMVFLRTGMDVLVINDCVLVKKGKSDA